MHTNLLFSHLAVYQTIELNITAHDTG